MITKLGAPSLTKDFWKELKSMEINKDNADKIICLLHILGDIERYKEKSIFLLCESIDQAVRIQFGMLNNVCL